MMPWRINAEHRLAKEGYFGQVKRNLPDAAVEAMFQAKLMGGYSKKRNPVCPGCFQMKSNSGTCGCTE